MSRAGRAFPPLLWGSPTSPGSRRLGLRGLRFGRLIWRPRLRVEGAEVVFRWVGHDHPTDRALADVLLSGSEADEPLDLLPLIVRPKVEVQAILDPLEVW